MSKPQLPSAAPRKGAVAPGARVRHCVIGNEFQVHAFATFPPHLDKHGDHSHLDVIIKRRGRQVPPSAMGLPEYDVYFHPRTKSAEFLAVEILNEMLAKATALHEQEAK